MKSVYDMNGIERAAALLIALGPEIAADILKYLDEDSIEKVTLEIAKIDRLDPADREELIGTFLVDLRKIKKGARGGADKARNLLTEVFGIDRAEEILAKITTVDVQKELRFLHDIDNQILCSFLKEEQPQIIAVIVNYLSPEKAGNILKMLPPDLSKEVALKIARMNNVTPEAVAAAARTLKKQYDDFRRKNSGTVEAGGIDSLINILRHMPMETERKIMLNLEREQPGISGIIKEKVFAFEDAAGLSNYEIRILIDEINDDRLIAKALKGAGDEMRFKFLRNMSQNRATDIIQDMDDMGVMRLSEVQASRNDILQIMRDLHDNGIISLKKDHDIYIE